MKNRLLVTLLSSFLVLTACSFNNDSKKEEDDPKTPAEVTFDLNGKFTDDDYLEVNGMSIFNQLDEKIYLHGINAGGLFVTESWMSAPRLQDRRTDHYNLTEVLYERFGEEKTLKIWQTYRENFWSEIDFINCKQMNMNVIRIPFTYMTLDPSFHNVIKKEGQEYNFDLLDEFVEGAASHGLYVILDLHGAYGSQNGQDHSGQTFSSADEVDFFYNEEKQNKTIHLWEELAKHYKDVNSIAAYDLLNEPGEKAGSTTTRHWEFFDKLYKAIRKIDDRRPLIMESCWDGANLPHPSIYGWEDVIYSFHNYSGQYDSSEANLESYRTKLVGVANQNFGVPCYMGEFNCYGVENSWKTVLSYMNSNFWHWTSWTYKLNAARSDRAYGGYAGWGIYYTKVPYMYFDQMEYEDIISTFERLHTEYEDEETEYEDVEKMTFASSTTLERIMKSYC